MLKHNDLKETYVQAVDDQGDLIALFVSQAYSSKELEEKIDEAFNEHKELDEVEDYLDIYGIHRIYTTIVTVDFP